MVCTAKSSGSGGGGGLEPNAEDGSSLATHMVLLTIIAGVVISSSLETVQHRLKTTWIPESSLAVLAGMLLGALIRLTVTEANLPNNLVFNGDVFFLVALPLLIFDAGFSLRKKDFFSQFFTILTFSVVGTAGAAMIIGGILYGAGQYGASLKMDLNEAFAYGSVLSATDALSMASVLRSIGGVDGDLVALVLGEGALNDATSIVLYQTFAGFFREGVHAESAGEAVSLFFSELVGSMALGLGMAVFSTLVFRAVHMGWLPRLRNVRFIFSLPSVYLEARARELTRNLAAYAMGGEGGVEERLPFARAYSAVRAELGDAPTPRAPSAGAASATPEKGGGEGAEKGTDLHAHEEQQQLTGYGALTAELALVRKLLAPTLTLTARRKLEPKPASSVFSQTLFIILMVGGMRARAPPPLPPPPLPTTHALTGTHTHTHARTQGYVSYLTAEALHLSGVATILFCGIGMNHFLRPLLSREGKEFSEGVVHVLALVADTSVFFMVGLDIALNLGTVRGIDTKGEGEMVGWALLALVVARTLTVFPLAFFINYFRGAARQLPWSYVVVLWFSSMRGANAYAFSLVFPGPNQPVLVDLTACVVLVSILFFTAALRPVVICLGISHGAHEEQHVGRFLPTEADDSDAEEEGAPEPAGDAPQTPAKAAGEKNYRVVLVQGARVYLPKVPPSLARRTITVLNRLDTQLRWNVSGVVRK
jgi:NhaP-type Na+/H+ or K+/H+ antiporter